MKERVGIGILEPLLPELKETSVKLESSSDNELCVLSRVEWSGDIWREANQGRLERHLAAPHTCLL